MTFVIDRDVPLPVTHTSAKWQEIPWDEMGVGDSIFIKNEGNERLDRLQHAVSASAAWYARRNSQRGGRTKRFKTVIDGVDGVRIWRIY